MDARLALDVASLRPGMVGVDVTPNPPRTRFIRDAEERGCRTLDGLAMLVGQGSSASSIVSSPAATARSDPELPDQIESAAP